MTKDCQAEKGYWEVTDSQEGPQRLKQTLLQPSIDRVADHSSIRREIRIAAGRFAVLGMTSSGHQSTRLDIELICAYKSHTCLLRPRTIQAWLDWE